MTQETEDVVTELRSLAAAIANEFDPAGLGGPSVSACDCAEPMTKAADLIQSLSDRIDVLEGALRQCARLARMESSSLASAIVETVNNSLIKEGGP